MLSVMLGYTDGSLRPPSSIVRGESTLRVTVLRLIGVRKMQRDLKINGEQFVAHFNVIDFLQEGLTNWEIFLGWRGRRRAAVLQCNAKAIVFRGEMPAG